MDPVDAEPDWMLRLSVDDGIATLTLDRPDKLNAWSWEASRQLGRRADQIRFDDSVRVVVVRAEGRAFCAGVDLGMPEDRVTGRSPAEKVRNYYEGIRWVHERFHAFSDLPQPIVAAVHGYCLGFGFELALMADIRVASERARFGELFVKRGLCSDAPGIGLLAQLVGRERAAELLFTGRVIDAQEAAAIGLVSRVVAHEELLPTAMTLATEIASNPPLAVQRMKHALRTTLDPDWHELGRWVSVNLAELFRTADHREGVAAFLEKREPRFSGS